MQHGKESCASQFAFSVKKKGGKTNRRFSPESYLEVGVEDRREAHSTKWCLFKNI